MLEWQTVDSKRITAEAYDPIAETIYVRFPNGIEWFYESCPPQVWDAFTAQGQSRGSFIHEVLNHKLHGKYE